MKKGLENIIYSGIYGAGTLIEKNITKYEKSKTKFNENKNKMMGGLAAYGILAIIPGDQAFLGGTALCYTGLKLYHMTLDYSSK